MLFSIISTPVIHVCFSHTNVFLLSYKFVSTDEANGEDMKHEQTKITLSSTDFSFGNIIFAAKCHVGPRVRNKVVVYYLPHPLICCLLGCHKADWGKQINDRLQQEI
jgi:hypothetical protein